ncbi:UNVERIFIED_CONTAM: hypothetical protein Slati_2927600 [Sesamum latifolium]|uniref:Uncharacterized protein n=1 Tax=Sesamum latifolium TaxID=2727402 RepID=A0AAW2VEA0_9LAMI
MAAEPAVATNQSKGNESPSRSEAIRVAPPRYGWTGLIAPIHQLRKDRESSSPPQYTIQVTERLEIMAYAKRFRPIYGGK